MSTTVVHPESVSGNGPSGRTIGMAVAGLVLAAGLGFAVANQSAPEVGVAGSPQVDAADIKYQEAGATRAAAEAARRQEVLQEATSGVSQGTVGAIVTQADFVAHTESLAGELQALQGVTNAVTQNEFIAHTQSLAGELQALQGVAKPTNQAIPWAEFVNGASVATAQELAQARRVAEIQAMNEYPANSEQKNDGPGLEPGASGIR
jgi:hypothetical protein